jgi:hypothetical protein
MRGQWDPNCPGIHTGCVFEVITMADPQHQIELDVVPSRSW